MISMTTIALGAWTITGLVALVMGTKVLCKPENLEKVKEQLREIAEELKITEEDCMCILQVSFAALGFIGVALVAWRRLKKYFKEKLDV